MNEYKFIYKFQIQKNTLFDQWAFGISFISDSEWDAGKYLCINFYKHQINIGWFANKIVENRS